MKILLNFFTYIVIVAGYCRIRIQCVWMLHCCSHISLNDLGKSQIIFVYNFQWLAKTIKTLSALVQVNKNEFDVRFIFYKMSHHSRVSSRSGIYAPWHLINILYYLIPNTAHPRKHVFENATFLLYFCKWSNYSSASCT